MCAYDLASLGIEVRADGVIVATKALRDLTKASRETESQTKRLKGATDSATSSFRSMESSLKLVQNVLRFEIFRRIADQAYEMGKSIYKANLEMQSINNTFKAATGSAHAGAQEMAFLREESKRLGIDLISAADAHRTLTAAARGTALEGEQARNIFLAISEASTVLGLSSQKTEMALYAVQQMISKGVVSMEELRRQLGDQLPGAFQTAARSMNMSERDFNKLVESGQLFTEDFMPAFIKALRDQWGPGVEDASQSARAELNRFNNAVLELKLEIGNAGFFNAMTEALRSFAQTLDDPQMKENMRAIGEFAGTLVSGISNFAKYASVGSVLGTQERMRSLVASGDLSESEYNQMWDKQGGWMGIKNLGTKSITEDLERQYEVQQRVYALEQEREKRRKEAQLLANPALMAREMEAAAKQSLELSARELAQQDKLRESRDSGFDKWKQSMANIDDQQRAINKLNDDYNAKIIAGISALKKYGITEEQAKALSQGEDIAGVDVMSKEQRRVVEQAKEQFRIGKEYRDKEEQDIIDKANREEQKTLDAANKRQKKINDISQDLAKLTMNDLDRELMEIDLKFSEVAAEIGKVPPELVKWRDLQRQLVQQNFADEMRDAMNDYLIQLKEAEVATSGVGQARLDVFTLEAERVAELTELRKEYYRVGADNSFYEDLVKLVNAQYDLKVGAAQYAEQWEGITRELEHAVELASALGRGGHAAQMALLKSERDRIAGDSQLDPEEKGRQLQLADARIFKAELDERRAQQTLRERALSQIMENTYNVGNIKEYFRVQQDMLTGQLSMLEIDLRLAETQEEQRGILAETLALQQKLRESKAAETGDVAELAKIGLGKFRSDNHMEIVEFYKNTIPDAIKSTSAAVGQFAADMATGQASITDAWNVIESSINSAVTSIIQDLTRLWMEKALLGVMGMLTGNHLFSGGATLNPSVAPSGASGLYYSVGHHAGGIVGSEPTFMRAVNPAIFAGADRFHTGGIAGDEVPAILKRGEGVFTPGQMKALAGKMYRVGEMGMDGMIVPHGRGVSTGGEVNVVIHNYAPNSKATATTKDDGRGGKSIEVVIDEIGGKNLARHGSASDRALRSRYNLSPALTGR